MTRHQWLAAVLLGLCCATANGEPTVTPVADGLDNPCGLAIQPDTGHVFLSDSGAGRVIRIVDGQVQDVIVGFKTEPYGKGPQYQIGPLGLLFLDRSTLVVGGGELADGEDQLRVFQVPDPGKEPLQVDQASASFQLPAQDDMPGEGNFYALARLPDAVFVTSHGDDTKGWIAKATVKGNQLTSFERFLATKEAVGVNAPVALAISPRGELVVGQMGVLDVPGDSLLTFYHAGSRKMLLNLEIGLHDVTALAYSPPPKGQLYCLDFAWMQSDQGGLFHLVATRREGKQGVSARKLLSLDKPTSLVFAPDGTLYVTVIGTATGGEDSKKPGRLLRVQLEP